MSGEGGEGASFVSADQMGELPYWQVINGGSEENNTSKWANHPFVTFFTSCLIISVLEEERMVHYQEKVEQECKVIQKDPREGT